MPLNIPFKTIAIAAAALVAATGAASAADSSNKANFSYKKSELANKQSVSKLYTRIKGEAKDACDLGYAPRSLEEKTIVDACTEKLADDWVAAIDDARLHRLAAGDKTGRDYASTR